MAQTDDFSFGDDSDEDPILNSQPEEDQVYEEAKEPEKETEAKAEKASKTERERSTDPLLNEEEESSESDLPEFDQEELLKVFDQILFAGRYEETVSLKGKLTARFKSKTAKETAEISRRVDNLGFNLMATLEQHQAMLNLAYSLIEYNGKDLSEMKPTPERYALIADLPNPIIDYLAYELNRFDYKVYRAFEEARENF